jgi:hypothetical protein
MADRVNFGEILQAIEDKLVSDGIVTPDQVVWSVNDEQVPHFSGEWDILLRAVHGFGDTKDGGDFDFRVTRIVEIRLRSLAITDSAATNKQWVTDQFIKHDKILNAVGNGRFEPVVRGKKLTLQSIKLRSDLAPERKGTRDTWGDSVCALEARYLPKVTPTAPSME